MKFNKGSLEGLKSTQLRSIKNNYIPEISLSVLKDRRGKDLPMFHGSESILLNDWAENNKQLIESVYNTHGALLFRGFQLHGDADFNQFARKVSTELMDYSEPSTPRLKVNNNIYTSTEYPKEQFIPMHNEHSYSNHWPQKIWFYCMESAASGGQTPIADSRIIFELIDENIREEFIRKGVMYIRNFSETIDLPWQHVFQTSDKLSLEKYCKNSGIEFEWKKDGNLRTVQKSQAVLTHPRTKDKLWFNQAHLFHYSNLEKSIQDYLLMEYKEEDLPRNSCFGDGTPIPVNYLEEIRKVYKHTELTFDWEVSDVLMLDNMLYAHGRNPFEGKRKILVAMAEPYHLKDQPGLSQIADQNIIVDTRHKTANFFIGQSGDKNEDDLKYSLAAAYRIMVSENLDEGGISGHITMRVPDHPGAFWVNPFGMLADEVTPHNLIKVDRTGKILEGDHPINVAGFCIHSAIHDAYPDVNCIVHTHSPWGTLFSALNRMIAPIDQNCCLFFENHSIYDEYNGPVNDVQDASKLAKALKGNDVIILKNHGTITCGTSISSAVMRMVNVERAYKLNILALQTPDVNLIEPEIARLTREWIGNDIGFLIEFNALVRKVERLYPDFRKSQSSNIN